MRQCLCSDYIRDQAAGFFFFELREFLCAILPACVLGDLLILVLCDDTILALRYIHALHTYGTYIYLHIHLSILGIYIYLSVCLYLRYNISFFFFFFLILYEFRSI